MINKLPNPNDNLLYQDYPLWTKTSEFLDKPTFHPITDKTFDREIKPTETFKRLTSKDLLILPKIAESENEGIFLDKSSTDQRRGIRYERIGSDLSLLDPKIFLKNDGTVHDSVLSRRLKSNTDLRSTNSDLHKLSSFGRMLTDDLKNNTQLISEITPNNTMMGKRPIPISKPQSERSGQDGLDRSTGNYHAPLDEVAQNQFFGNNSKPDFAYSTVKDYKFSEDQSKSGMNCSLNEQSKGQCPSLGSSSRFKNTLNKSAFNNEMLRGRLPSSGVRKFQGTELPRGDESKEYPQYLISKELMTSSEKKYHFSFGKSQAMSHFTFQNKNNEFSQSQSNNIFQGKNMNQSNLLNLSELTSKNKEQLHNLRLNSMKNSMIKNNLEFSLKEKILNKTVENKNKVNKKNSSGGLVMNTLKQNVEKLNNFKGLNNFQSRISGDSGFKTNFSGNKSNDISRSFSNEMPNMMFPNINNKKQLSIFGIKNSFESFSNNQKNIFRNSGDLKPVQEENFCMKSKIPEFTPTIKENQIKSTHSALLKRDYANFTEKNTSNQSQNDSPLSNMFVQNAKSNSISSKKKLKKFQIPFKESELQVRVENDSIIVSGVQRSMGQPEKVELVIKSKYEQLGKLQMRQLNRDLSEVQNFSKERFFKSKQFNHLTNGNISDFENPLREKNMNSEMVLDWIRNLDEQKFEVSDRSKVVTRSNYWGGSYGDLQSISYASFRNIEKQKNRKRFDSMHKQRLINPRRINSDIQKFKKCPIPELGVNLNINMEQILKSEKQGLKSKKSKLSLNQQNRLNTSIENYEGNRGNKNNSCPNSYMSIGSVVLNNSINKSRGQFGEGYGFNIPVHPVSRVNSREMDRSVERSIQSNPRMIERPPVPEFCLLYTSPSPRD